MEYESPGDPVLKKLNESFGHLSQAREVLRQARADYEYAQRVYNKNVLLVALSFWATSVVELDVRLNLEACLKTASTEL